MRANESKMLLLAFIFGIYLLSFACRGKVSRMNFILFFFFLQNVVMNDNVSMFQVVPQTYCQPFFWYTVIHIRGALEIPSTALRWLLTVALSSFLLIFVSAYSVSIVVKKYKFHSKLYTFFFFHNFVRNYFYRTQRFDSTWTRSLKRNNCRKKGITCCCSSSKRGCLF